METAKVAITGAAGFLGTALSARLPGARLSDGVQVGAWDGSM